MTPYPRPTIRSLILRAGLMRALSLAKSTWNPKCQEAKAKVPRLLDRIDKSV